MAIVLILEPWYGEASPRCSVLYLLDLLNACNLFYGILSSVKLDVGKANGLLALYEEPVGVKTSLRSPF